MHPPALVLLIEDNRDVLQINRQYFEMAGYAVQTAATLAEARALVEQARPDLLVLDIMLPDGSGLDFCEELRKSSPVPVLFLTCLDQEEQIIAGLRTGGDEYMTKPYRVAELVARAEALLRRVRLEREHHAEKTELGPLRLDSTTMQAFLNGEDMLLAPKEFAVLRLLVRNEGRPMTKEALYESVWNQAMNDDDGAVKNVLYRLRKKLETAHSALSITVTRGEGYRLDREDAPE